MTDMPILTIRGRDLLHRFKVKYDLPADATIERCLAAFLEYDEARVNSLDKEETHLMMSLMAHSLKDPSNHDNIAEAAMAPSSSAEH
jgi:hypothetical protein